MWGAELLVMALMIAVNSVLAAYEIALASITLGKLEVLASEKKKGAVAASNMKRNVERSLAGIQLGITLVGAIAAATGGAGAEEQLAPYLRESFGLSASLAEFIAITIVVIPLTFITIIFGELIPKIFALRNQEWVCLKLSPSIQFFVRLVWPVVWILETVVNKLMKLIEGNSQESASETGNSQLQELRTNAALARTLRLIGPQEEKIIVGATDLTTRPVREAMISADGISTLNANDDIASALVVAHLDMHTRFPITEEKANPQSIIGYVNFKDIVAHMRLSPKSLSLRELIRPLPSFSDDTPVSVCLERLIREHVHIALIRDSAQQVVGMVTLEDLLEELVGDIEDEFDHLPSHVVPIGKGWIVGGGCPLSKIAEVTGLQLFQPNQATALGNLNDWITNTFEVPALGGEFVFNGTIRIVVRKIRRQKIQEAQLERVRP